MPGPQDGLIAALKPGTMDSLREHYDKARQGLNLGMPHNLDLPYAPPPSYFQPDPFVVGRPEQARQAKTLLDLSPMAKHRVKSMTFGPTEASMDIMNYNNLPMDKFGGTALNGVFDTESGAIGINPDRDPLPTLKTMAHEVGHGAGYFGEEGAKAAGNMIDPDPAPIPKRSPGLTDKQIDAILQGLKNSKTMPKYVPR